MRANLHYTGFLLEWLEEKHTEFIELLRTVVGRDQVELVGGAYFEPVISVIPDIDASGQTDLLSKKIVSLFGKDPQGFWTAERAWEPHLPEILDKMKTGHSFIDDVSFQSVGLTESDCFEPYVVESRGHCVTVFPILKKLRYFMPFKSVRTTISYLKQARSNGSIALFGDDGEKFGAWPSTFDTVYRDGWLDTFFREISEQSWIETVKISEYLRENPPKKRIYLPASAYSEMMEWAIPFIDRPNKRQGRGEDSEKIPHRGFWRLFLAKYPESARIYSKMLYLSQSIHSSDKNENTETIRELWKGQCNDAYWHGVFGGLYSPILRKITYKNLIRAQIGLESEIFGTEGNWTSAAENPNSRERQIQMNSKYLGVVILPERGGGMCELDYKPLPVNIMDTLTRRPERYHSEIKKRSQRTIVPQTKRKKKRAVTIHDSPELTEKGLQDLLVYDRYDRLSFLDYVVRSDSKPDSFLNQDFKEIAPLPATVYGAEIQKSNQAVGVAMSAAANTVGVGKITVKKRITLLADQSSLKVEYELEFKGKNPEPVLFLPEINLGGLSDQRFSDAYGKETVSINSNHVEINYKDSGFSAGISCENADAIWMVPIRTVSLSEKGFESNLQGISILPNYLIKLGSAGNLLRTSVEVSISPI